LQATNSLPEVAIPDEKLQRIAAQIRDTRANVYVVAAMCLGCQPSQVGEKIFDLLEQKHRLFKCEGNCNIWQDLSEREPDLGESSICRNCIDEMNARMNEDNDE
jgi:hypothetical protein